MLDRAASSRRRPGAFVAAPRLKRAAAAIVAGLAVLGSAGGCGDDDADKPKAANLTAQLPAATAFPGYREFGRNRWTEAVDLGAKLHRSEQTLPSVQLNALEDAGFVSGATAEFFGPKDRNHVVSIIQFESSDGAEEFREHQYKEELKQPCAAACSEQGGSVPISGIPGAKGTKQVPAKNPPRDAPPPFTAYVVLFAVGPNLYVVEGEGRGDDPAVKGETVKAAEALYARVKQ